MADHLTFSGRLGADLELKQTQNGDDMVRFGIARNRPGKDLPEDTPPLWANFAAYDNIARNAVASLKKGDFIRVQARLDNYPLDVQIKGEGKTLNMITFRVEEISVPLNYVSVEITKNPFDDEKSDAPARQGGNRQGGGNARPAAKAAAPAGAKSRKPAPVPAGGGDFDEDEDF